MNDLWQNDYRRGPWQDSSVVGCIGKLFDTQPTQNRRRPSQKWRRPKIKTTKNEDDEKRRQPKTKMTKN